MADLKMLIATTSDFVYKDLLEHLGLPKENCQRLADYNQIRGMDTNIPIIIYGRGSNHPGYDPRMADAIKQASFRGHPIFTLSRYR